MPIVNCHIEDCIHRERNQCAAKHITYSRDGECLAYRAWSDMLRKPNTNQTTTKAGKNVQKRGKVTK